MTTTDTLTKAVKHISTARDQLRAAGIEEQLFPLTVDVASEQWQRFFYTFGEERGCYLSLESSSIPYEVILRFGIRRRRGSFLSRLKECFRSIWSILCNHDIEYSVHLKEHEVTDLKNILRRLESQK